MNSFKRCSTAVALVMASAIPAVAQDTVALPERVLLQVEGTNSAYRVPYAVAAELCGDVDPTVLESLAQDADVIYCTIAETVVIEQGFADSEDMDFFEDLNEAEEINDEADDDGEDDTMDDDMGDDDDEESGDNGEDGGTDGTGSDDDGNDDIDVDLDGTDDTEGSPDNDDLIDDGDDGEGSDGGDMDGSDDGDTDGSDDGSEDDANDDDDGALDGDEGTDDGADGGGN